MKTKFYTINLLVAFGLSAQAGVIFTYGGGNAAIPDNNTIGLAESVAADGLETGVSAVTLNFTLASGFGTDLTGYLRLGNTTSSPYYSLTSLVQSHPVISASGVNFNVDVSSAFSGQNPNDTWTLFFADTGAGGTTTLDGGWTLEITAVPEPVNVALEIFGAGLLALAGFRARRKISVWRPAQPCHESSAGGRPPHLFLPLGHRLSAENRHEIPPPWN